MKKGKVGDLQKVIFTCARDEKYKNFLINNARLMFKRKGNLNLWHIIYMLSTTGDGK